jgi:hypothetical protein
MNRPAMLGGVILAACFAGGAMLPGSDIPAEDEPGWNCYTQGNGECGATLTYFRSASDPDAFGAVLPAANDGRVYVSWPDGRVTLASSVQVSAAWDTCMANAEGGDASLQACDADFPGGWQR